MAIETEVKFRMDGATWAEIKEEYDRTCTLHDFEEQTNQYYNTAGHELEEQKIGLRLRVMADKSVLTIKRDTEIAYKREEIEETYPAGTERLPKESPALQKLLNDVGASYDQLVPLVMMTTRRSVYLIEEANLKAEICVDDVSIINVCKEHKLYEVEFELVEGSEERLLEIADEFAARYGDRVERSSVPKLVYALELVSGSGC
jgi:triphosphatase